MKVIGITGGVGSGKTEVLKILEQDFAAYIIIADDVARELSQKGQVSYEHIVNTFGHMILAPNGEIDRVKLGEIVFDNEFLLKQLNSFVHPYVKEEIKKRITEAQKDDYYKMIVVEAALLIEDGYKEICDELWYIRTDREIRRRRLKMSRNYSDEKINAIMDSQLSDEAFRGACDRMIINNTNLDDLYSVLKDALD